MAKQAPFYLLDHGGGARSIIDSQNGGVIARDGNARYEEYVAWLEEGNTPEVRQPEA